MLFYIWLYVMTSAFFPGGERIASAQANAYQNHVRASIETPRAPMTLGWALEAEVPHL